MEDYATISERATPLWSRVTSSVNAVLTADEKSQLIEDLRSVGDETGATHVALNY